MPPDDQKNSDQIDAAKEPARLAEAEPRGDPAPSDAGAPQTLSVLFIAAALALVALLAVIGLIAFAAMSK